MLGERTTFLIYMITGAILTASEYMNIEGKVNSAYVSTKSTVNWLTIRE